MFYLNHSSLLHVVPIVLSENVQDFGTILHSTKVVLQLRLLSENLFEGCVRITTLEQAHDNVIHNEVIQRLGITCVSPLKDKWDFFVVLVVLELFLRMCE